MWNDTDVPLAIFYTFRTYGTWLHGDERTSIDRHNNKYGALRNPPSEQWELISSQRMKHPPVLLDARMRKAVKIAIYETCERRGWGLYAAAIRTNHVHVVTGG